MKANEKEYALYKGENLISIGTIEEISKELKIKPETVKFYGTRSHITRTSENCRRLISLDD